MLEVHTTGDAWGAAYVACSLSTKTMVPVRVMRSIKSEGRLSKEHMSDPAAIREVSSLLCHTMTEIVSNYNEVVQVLNPDAPAVKWEVPSRVIDTPRGFRSLIRRIERTSKRIYISIDRMIPRSAQYNMPSYKKTMLSKLGQSRPNRMVAGYCLMFTMPHAHLYLRNGIGVHSSDKMIMDSLKAFAGDPNVSLAEIARNIRSRIDLMDAVYDYHHKYGEHIKVPYHRMKDTQEFTETRDMVLSGGPRSWIQSFIDAF